MVTIRRADNGQVSQVDSASLRYGVKTGFTTLAWGLTSPAEKARAGDVPYIRPEPDALFCVRVDVIPSDREAFLYWLTTPPADALEVPA